MSLDKLFNFSELEKEWSDIDNFYEDEWEPDTLDLTETEKEILEELTSNLLPRHMAVYDWNLPYAELIILKLRNILKTKLK